MDAPAISFPEESRCLGCGYRLRGLPECVCPECGRAFDPGDPKTFDTRPEGWRRRRWIRRGIWVGVIAVIYFALGPRAILTGQLALRCPTCGENITVYRFEPNPPTWIPWRYPGFRWTARGPATNATGSAGCAAHHFGDLKTRFDFRHGQASGNANAKPNEVPVLNDEPTTPATAHAVLRNLMSPENTGISVCNQPAP